MKYKEKSILNTDGAGGLYCTATVVIYF